jgi:pyruvate formate lyase activating enzyme
MDGPRDTSPEDLLRAVELGQQAGLRYIYAGNVPGQVGEWENTRCVQCGLTLIERQGYFIAKYAITAEGCCPSCQTPLPGRWDAQFRGQITQRPFLPQARPHLVTIHN